MCNTNFKSNTKSQRTDYQKIVVQIITAMNKMHKGDQHTIKNCDPDGITAGSITVLTLVHSTGI